MKYRFKRIISFSLSICIVIMAIYTCPMYVYASDHGGGGGSDHTIVSPEDFVGHTVWNKMTNAEKWNMVVSFVIAETKSLFKGDLSQFLAGQTAIDEYINAHEPDEVITVTETGLTIPADLVALIKQALIEYSEETNGFYLLPTTDYRTVPVENFTNYSHYKTFKNIVEEQGVVAAFMGWGYNDRELHFINCFSDPDDHVSLVGESGMVNKLKNTPWAPVGVTFYGTYDWTIHKYKSLYFPDFRETEKVYKSLSEATEFTGSSSYMNEITGGTINFDMNQHGSYSPKSAKIIYSTTGERIRVFVSANAMKNYTAGQRTVYFGKGFYDYQPADITATWDEINDRIAHIDDILQQLLDKITDADDEDAIEDLLQQILDAINNGGGGGGNTGTGGGSTGSGGAPEHWYDQILDYLNKILKQLKSIKRWTIIDTFIDGIDAIADWLDLIHDILSDADDGLESAVSTLSSALDSATGLLKKKFPFSVPWDILFLVTLLAAEPETPHFEFPIDFDITALDMHIHYDFVLDFSQYQYLSDIARAFLSMTYAVGLMKMTAGIVSTKKEE